MTATAWPLWVFLVCCKTSESFAGTSGGTGAEQRRGALSRSESGELMQDSSDKHHVQAAVNFVSNSSHITWPCGDVQFRSDAERECILFLKKNLMKYDIPNLGTLGFPAEDDENEKGVFEKGSKDALHSGTKTARIEKRNILELGISEESNYDDVDLPDGLSNGLVWPTVKLSLKAKVEFPWTRHVPKNVYQEYVLNFASANEGRSDWRPLLYKMLKPHLDDLLRETEDEVSVEDVVGTVNEHLWTAASPTGTKIVFKSGHTPLIFDPMSVMIFGYASCTGLSILLVCGLRAAGIPARIAGTAAWLGDPDKGNHSWVEVYDQDGQWKVIEPLEGVKGMRNPCDNWFCTKDRFGGGKTKVHAARLRRVVSKIGEETSHFPLAWDMNNRGVPGEDRSDFMEAICTHCQY